MTLYKDQEVKIYNTLSKSKVKLEPIISGNIGMYVCGPTVYNKVHLGNCRTFISFDLIYRYLKFLGYKVRYVRNITDVGHLENDNDFGEDRISKKARLEELEPMEIVQKYTSDFHKTLSHFNTLNPSIEPTATGHIVEQIEMIKSILKSGFAYKVNGSVYFNVAKYNKKLGKSKSEMRYGVLSGRVMEDQKSNSRTLSSQSEKKHPNDFALWKKAGESHIMKWPSPWSFGFPGWHLECSAMSTKYLGDEFDIHGGGMDLKFPHHECEIAQSYSFNKKDPVKYWMHANMLTLNGQKMSKSTGLNILPEEIFSGTSKHLEKVYSPMVVKFSFLQAHYRNVMDFSNEALASSEKAFKKILGSIKRIENLKVSDKSTVDISSFRQSCFNAMNDDFNSPVLISKLFEGLSIISKIEMGDQKIDNSNKDLLESTFNQFIFDVLGLKVENSDSNPEKLDQVMKVLIQIRNEARDKKDFSTADSIRDMLNANGIQIHDGGNESNYSID